MYYEDFVIQIGPDHGKGHTVHVLTSPAGEGDSRLFLPRPMHTGTTAVGPARGAGRGLAAGRPLAIDHEATPHEIGDTLFRALFRGTVRHLYDKSAGSVEARGGRGLRIKLRLNPRHYDVSRIYDLPWELLYNTDTDEFLSLSRHRSIVRYLEVPQAISELPLPAPLRILVVISSPEGLEPLDLVREQEAIESAWGTQSGVEVHFLEVAHLLTLRRTLREKDFHVLHFMGHGDYDPEKGEGRLLLEGEDRRPVPVSGRVLATNLSDSKTLRLIFLNACHSARSDTGSSPSPYSGVASALVLGGVPAVVAMRSRISDHAAIAFSQTFYRALAAGEPVDDAVAEGRLVVFGNRPRASEWGIPVLFMRTPDGRLFSHQSLHARTQSGRSTTRSSEQDRSSRWPRKLEGRVLPLLVATLAGVLLGSFSSPSESLVRIWRELTELDLSAPATDTFVPSGRDASSSQGGGGDQPAPNITNPPPPGPAFRPEEPPSDPASEEEKNDRGDQAPTERALPHPPDRPTNGSLVMAGSLRLRYVRGGTFWMGSPADEHGANPVHERRHRVTLSRDYLVAESEVTQAQWLKYFRANPAAFRDLGPQVPIDSVNWFQAIEYTNRLSRDEDLQACYDLSACTGDFGEDFRCQGVTFVGLDCPGYRLPTEAEWEYAARAGGKHAFGMHPIPSTDRIHFFPACDSCGYPGMTGGQEYVHAPRKAGSLPPNAWGLRDMLGNVREWTWDHFAPYVVAVENDPSVDGPTDAARVQRGGSWSDGAISCRVSARHFGAPASRAEMVGFRVVKSVTAAKAVTEQAP